MEKHNIIIKEGKKEMRLRIPSLKLKGWPMGNGEFKVTIGGIKLIATILVIIGVLFGAYKGYVIYSQTTVHNYESIKELKPLVSKNEKEIIRIIGKIEPIGKRQERMCVRQEKMDEKLDKILEKVR
jgi:hypothetical protein